MPSNDIHLHTQKLPPTILTIFGATGDLSADYLVPALLHMDAHKLLPKTFKLVCVGRRQLDAKGYLEFILKKSHVLKKLPTAKKNHFLRHLIYYQGNFESLDDFKGLTGILADQ